MKASLLCLSLFLLSSCYFFSASAMPADSLMNVIYSTVTNAKGTKQSLAMNIYFPKREVGKTYPLILLMHGGGFLNGNKNAMKGQCWVMADSGFVAVTIDYRTGWDAGANPFACEGKVAELQMAVYRATQDAHAALRYLVEKQAEYTIDTNWLFTGGSSAGGVLALNLAYLNDEKIKVWMPAGYKGLGSLDEATDNHRKNFTIKGVCNMWGALPDSSLITPATAVPTIFFHGNADMVVPYDVGRYGSICENYPLMYGSACLYRQTIAAGKPAVLNTSIGGNHGPKEFWYKITMSNTACFFRKVMAGIAVSNTFTDAKRGCQ